MGVITGEHLRIARIVYGYESQEALGQELGVSLGTIQRYEASETVDAKVLGVYEYELHFDIASIVEMLRTFNKKRNLLIATYKGQTVLTGQNDLKRG